MLARNVYTKKHFAIKIVSKADAEKVSLEAFMKVLRNEVDILSRLDHQHIIKLVESNLKGDYLYLADGRKILVFYIVLEFAEGGDLFDYLQVLGKGFSEEVSRYYFHQLVNAIEYLHNT
jgi:serine/threonine protein kinase